MKLELDANKVQFSLNVLDEISAKSGRTNRKNNTMTGTMPQPMKEHYE